MADRIYHQVLAGCVGCRGATAYSNHNLPLNGRCCFAILSETHDELDEVCLQCASRPLVTIPVGLTWGAAQHLPDSSTQQFVLNVQRTLGNPTTVEIGYVGSVSRHLAYLLDENQGISDPRTVVTRGSSYENEYNLSPDFLVRLKEAYEGTRLGRQEIHAELLEDVPGALWKRDLIESYRVKRAPALNSVLVAIDPAASASETSDETGIIVVGRGRDGHLYVLEDLSGRFSPRQWAQRAIDAYHRHKADRIVAEKNNGGDMVAAVLRSVWLSVPYYGVHASRGKVPRAQPVVSLYEQGKVHHVGLHRALEDQMCTFVPDAPEGSPDRVDALVWGLTELGPLRRPPCIISLINDEPLSAPE